MPRKIKTHKPKPTTREQDDGQAFYNSTRWRRLRKMFLTHHPLCSTCGDAANEVHHLKPRKEYPELELEWDNLESQCTSCHSKKTRATQLGKGNQARPVVITGKRGSGKTYWVSQNKQPDDLVFDFDQLASAVNFSTNPRPHDVASLVLAWREELVHRIATAQLHRRCLIIVSDPIEAADLADKLGANLLNAEQLPR